MRNGMIRHRALLTCALVLGLCGCEPKPLTAGHPLAYHEAWPYVQKWMDDNCWEYMCDGRANSLGPIISAYHERAGWVYVLRVDATRSGGAREIDLLIPDAPPHRPFVPKD